MKSFLIALMMNLSVRNSIDCVIGEVEQQEIGEESFGGILMVFAFRV